MISMVVILGGMQLLSVVVNIYKGLLGIRNGGSRDGKVTRVRVIAQRLIDREGLVCKESRFVIEMGKKNAIRFEAHNRSDQP